MMTEVTNELIYEVLKELQTSQSDMKAQLHSINEELNAIRTHMSGFQVDISNLYTTQTDIKNDLGRVQTRLNLSDEKQRFFGEHNNARGSSVMVEFERVLSI